MAVNSVITSPNYGDLWTSQAIAGALITATTGGVAIDFAADFTRFDGTDHDAAVSLANSVLQILTIVNNSSTVAGYVQLDGLVTSGAAAIKMMIPAGQSFRFCAFATTVAVKLYSASGTIEMAAIAQFTSVQ